MELLQFYKKHRFVIYLVVTILIFVILILLKKNNNGTWSTNYFYIPQVKSNEIQEKGESKIERDCKSVMERIFNKPFRKIRPNFLNNPITGKNMELDIYNDELKVACEANGIQHYRFTPYFHKSIEVFRAQKYRDYIKRQLCKDNGILLIEVPYDVKDIQGFILKELMKSNRFKKS